MLPSNDTSIIAVIKATFEEMAIVNTNGLSFPYCAITSLCGKYGSRAKALATSVGKPLSTFN